MTWTYTGDPSVSDVAAVRFEIQDTNSGAPLLQDGEVAWAILDENGVAAATPAVLTGAALYRASARCCEVLSRQLAMQADTSLGEIKETYSHAAQTYAARAQELRTKASGLNVPYAGGQSISEKQSFRENEDAVQPKFRRNEFNNPYTGWWGAGLPPAGE